MIKGLLFSILLLVASSSTTQGFQRVAAGGGESLLAMHLVGSADGKDFYFDKSVARTWTGAKGYCGSEGMSLASFESEAQMEMLIKSNATGFASGICYWTAGRDSTQPTQFSWDNTNSTMELFGSRYEYFGVYRSCICFFKESSPYFRALPCDNSMLAYTMCQS